MDVILTQQVITYLQQMEIVIPIININQLTLIDIGLIVLVVHTHSMYVHILNYGLFILTITLYPPPPNLTSIVKILILAL